MNSPQFKRALFDVHNRECERFAAEMEPVVFSPRLERKMARLLRAQRKPYYPLMNTGFKKVVLAAVLTIILMTTTVFGVSALREPVIRFIIEVYEKFSLVFVQPPPQEEEKSFPALLEVYYAPAWLPEGYQEDVEQMVDAVVLYERTYLDESENEIRFKQYTMIATVSRIDTEGVQTKQVALNGHEGLFFSNKGIQQLLWNDGQYYFTMLGPVTEAEMLRMAESIRPVEMKK